MQLQEKNNKGFTILEVVVVLLIVGIISALAYPGISNWAKDREVSSAAIKIKNLFTNINAQVQRGLYGFVQVYVFSGDTVTVVSKGMFSSTLGAKISSDDDFDSTSISKRCRIDEDAWDEDGQIDINKPEVGMLNFEDEIALSFIGEATVCFSKDGRWYSADGLFINNNDPLSAMYICEKSAGSCTDNVGNVPAHVENLYAVSWTRFGNITLERYNPKTDAWIVQ
tara:strand:- start:1412 stop:2086 length:675 start_codon:yes stop_codon:yes gene_type:complete